MIQACTRREKNVDSARLPYPVRGWLRRTRRTGYVERSKRRSDYDNNNEGSFGARSFARTQAHRWLEYIHIYIYASPFHSFHELVNSWPRYCRARRSLSKQKFSFLSFSSSCQEWGAEIPAEKKKMLWIFIYFFGSRRHSVLSQCLENRLHFLTVWCTRARALRSRISDWRVLWFMPFWPCRCHHKIRK